MTNHKGRLHLHRRAAMAGLAVLVAGGLAAPGASAQDDWPTDAVTVVVAYPAGGGTDSIARQLADAIGVFQAGPASEPPRLASSTPQRSQVHAAVATPKRPVAALPMRAA